MNNNEREAFEAWMKDQFMQARDIPLGTEALQIMGACTEVYWQGWKARAEWQRSQSAPAGYVMVQAIDAAMIEMANISPPMRRSECERLIRAALAAAPKAEPMQEPVYQIHRPVDVWERHWFWVDVDKEEFDALEDATKGRILYAAPQPSDDAKDALVNQLGVALERLIATGLDQRTHHEFMTQKDNHARLAFEAYRAAMGSKGDE